MWIRGVVGLMLAVSHGVAVADSPESVATVNIKVKSTKIRSQPKMWASAVGSVKYGDSVQTLGLTDGWLKVRSAGKVGYLHESAVTEKKVILSARSMTGDGSADRGDVVLAGKGFNQAVEKDLAAKDRSLNFKAVDEMERLKVSDSELGAFMRAGQLGSKG